MKRALSLLLALSVAACTKAGTHEGTGGRINGFTQPHVLRYATAEDLAGLNPALNQQVTLSLMSSLTMAWLIKYDRANRPVPELALVVPSQENGGISPDGRAITYHLRKGVKWSDGAPFTADDVLFSERAIMNPANNIVSRGGWDLITKVDEPDKYTVTFHLKKPYASALVTFFSSAGANPSVLPKHILGALPNINKAAYNSLPVGIGPFKYAQWKREESVTLVADPLYFRGRPKLDKIVFKIIPNRDTVLAQLKSGELDLWYPVPGAYFQFRKDLEPKFVSLAQPAYGFNHIDFNLTRPVVKELAVRQALRYAIDRQELIDKIAHGSGIVQDSPLSPSAPYAVHGVGTTPFDLAKANKLLDDAGWKPGSDGVRVKNGQRLNLQIASSVGSQDVDQMIELLRSNWKKIGVSMDVRKYQSSLLFAPLADGGIIYGGKFDAVFFAWSLDPIGDVSNLYSCDQIPPNGQNVMHWCDKTASDAMAKFKLSYSESARQPYLDVTIKRLVADVPTVVTKVNNDNYLYNADLKNFHPNQVSWFDDFMNVDI